MEEKEKRNKWLHLRLTQDEYDQLLKRFSQSNETKLSRYARKIFLAQPINVIHRNASLDGLIAILTKVQRDLNGVTNNYNQMLHRLHISDTDLEVRRWISQYEKEKPKLFSSIEEISAIITKTAREWLR